MAGCYGNSTEDRYYEQMLYNYLDSCDNDTYICECGFEALTEDWYYDDDLNDLICPECNKRIRL